MSESTPFFEKDLARKESVRDTLQPGMQTIAETRRSWWTKEQLLHLGIKVEHHKLKDNATRLFKPIQGNPLDLLDNNLADEFGDPWDDRTPYYQGYSTIMRMESYLDTEVKQGGERLIFHITGCPSERATRTVSIYVGNSLYLRCQQSPSRYRSQHTRFGA